MTNPERRVWTDAEVAVLRRVYPSQGLAATCLALPTRTRASIEQRCNVLGIRREGPPAFVKVWTEAENATLRRVYPTGGAKAAHRELPHRSKLAIMQQCSKLDIHRKWSGSRAPKEKPKVVASVAKPKPLVIREGLCDRGDEEFIRRRIEFVIGTLSAELRRHPTAVKIAIRNLANKKFEPDAIARISIPRDEA